MKKLMKMAYYFTILLVLQFLVACSMAQHSADRDYDQDQKITVPDTSGEKGPVTANNILVNNFYFGEIDSQNNADQEPSNRTDMDGAVGLNGGTGTNTAKGALSVVDRVVSSFDGHQDASQKASNNDNSKNSSDKTNPGRVEAPVAPTLINPSDPVPPEQYNAAETYDLKLVHSNTRSQTWFNRPGRDWGGPIKITFSACDEFLNVQDPSRAWSKNGDLNNHHQTYYWSGDPSQQRDLTGGFKSSVFSSKECLGKVTVHYNK